MAFVNLPASNFLGQKSRQESKCVASRRIPQTGRSVKMSFSSIDKPEDARQLFDTEVCSKSEIIEAAYKHVFGNCYLMDSERAELAQQESEVRLGNMSVRELVRMMGKSVAYRKRFFSRSGAYGFVELNCKHFLGRGPTGQEEISFHVQKLVNEGYEAEIDSYIDSGEYMERFGEDCVPRFIFKGTYVRNDDFNRMTVMRMHWDGCSTSTVSGSTAPGKAIPSKLTMGRGDHYGNPFNIMRGLPAGFRPTVGPTPAGGLCNAKAGVRVRIKVADNLYQVFEVAPMYEPAVPEWKKELEGKKTWNGVWF